MKRICLVASLVMTSVGCEQAPLPDTAATEEISRRPSFLAIREMGLHEPLERDEVLAFVELVQAFPNSQLPEFSPSVASESIDHLPPERAVEAWRASLRQTLTPESLIENWRPRSAQRRILTENQITPKALMSLMLRLSCALAAETIDRDSSLSSAHRKAEQNVTMLTRGIERASRSQTSDMASLWSALEESTMLAEYLALLTEVPAESRSVVAGHRQSLAAILPVSATLTAPMEQREESHITPVEYEEPATEPQRPLRDWKTR